MTSAPQGGRGHGKADKVREFSKGGCVKMRMGSKNPKILWMSQMEAPLLFHLFPLYRVIHRIWTELLLMLEYELRFTISSPY